MKSVLINAQKEITSLIFTGLAIVVEIGYCLIDAFLDWMGYKMPTNRIGIAYVKVFLPCIIREHRLKGIKNLVNFRITGQVVILILHVYHLIWFYMRLENMLPAHPELKEVKDMGLRHFTTWNLILQIFYVSLALTCDISTVSKREDLVPDWMRNYRFVLFSGLVWPVPWALLLYWPLYWFRNDLIFKPGFGPLIAPSNFQFHGMVLLFALWELIFMPKQIVKYKTKATLLHVLAFCSVFVITILYTKFIEPKTWIYHIFDHVDEMSHIGLIMASVCGTIYLAYRFQDRIKIHYWVELGYSKKSKIPS